MEHKQGGKMKETQEKQVKVKKSFTGIFGLILFILSVIMVMMTLGVGAWARYVTSRSSNAATKIAKSIDSIMVSLVTVVPKHFAIANALCIMDKERSGLHL